MITRFLLHSSAGSPDTPDRLTVLLEVHRTSPLISYKEGSTLVIEQVEYTIMSEELTPDGDRNVRVAAAPAIQSTDLLEVYDNTMKAHGINLHRSLTEEAHSAAINAVGNAAALHANRVLHCELEKLGYENHKLREIGQTSLDRSNLIDVVSMGIPTELDDLATKIVTDLEKCQHDKSFCVRYTAQEIKRFAQQVARVAALNTLRDAAKSVAALLKSPQI